MSSRLTSGQVHVELKGDKPATLAAAIAKHAETHISATESHVLTVVLSNVIKLEVLVSVAQALGSLPNWTLTLRNLEKTKKHGPHIGLVINRMIPFGQAQLPSEGLFLGPFKEFPKTRQAPVAAFELFVGVPLPNDPKTKEPTTKANLAHITIPTALPESRAFDHMWTKSKKGRRKSLGINVSVDDAEEVPRDADDLRAKAKIAFAIPASIAKKLGITP